MTGLLDLARAQLGPQRAHGLFAAEHRVALSFTLEANKGQVRVTGAGPTIEAAIDAAAAKLERGKACSVG